MAKEKAKLPLTVDELLEQTFGKAWRENLKKPYKPNPKK